MNALNIITLDKSFFELNEVRNEYKLVMGRNYPDRTLSKKYATNVHKTFLANTVRDGWCVSVFNLFPFFHFWNADVNVYA
jgi:hypothetical protein